MQKVSLIILGIIVIALSAYLLVSPTKVMTITEVQRDTVTTERFDTIAIYKPQYIYETKIDTVVQIITNTDTFYVPVIQRRYFESGLYDIYISGANPQLDSVSIFQQTKLKTITNTINNTIYESTNGLYLNAGILYYNSKYSPSIGAEWVTNKNINLGLNVGLIESNPIIFATFGYKIK